MKWQTQSQHISAKRETSAIRRKLTVIQNRRNTSRLRSQRAGQPAIEYIIRDCEKEIVSLNKRIKDCNYFLNPCLDVSV